MKHSRTEYALINILTGFGGYFINAILGYICRVIFVKCLNADYLGANELFVNILSMLSLAELGIGSAIGFALYKPLAEDDKTKIISLMRFYGRAYQVIGVVVALGGLLMMPFLDWIIKTPPNISENLSVIYLLFLFNTASTYFFSYRGTLLTAAQRNYIVLGLNYIVTCTQSLVQIVLLLLTHNYLIYLLVQTVSIFVNNVLISKIAQREYPFIKSNDAIPLSKDEKRVLFINIKALTINRFATILVNSTDNIVITFLDGLVSVGLASNYNLLVNTLKTLVTQLFNGLTASIGNLNAMENDEKKYRFFKLFNLTNFWIFGWGTIGIVLVSGDIVRLCFGEEYVLGTAIPIILAVNFYMVGMQNAVYAYKNTMGLFRYGQYILLITAAINLILDFVLGIKWGIFGIYLATAIARLFTNTWYEPYAVFKYGLKKPFILYVKKYLEYLLLLIFTGTICYFLCALCTFQVFTNLLLKLLICSIIPNVIFFLCYHKTEEGKYLVEMVIRICKKVLYK